MILALLAWATVWVFSLIEILRRWSDEAWALSGQNRLAWFLVVLFFQFFGLLFYLSFGRPRLKAAEVHFS
ncbi:MAG TPA: PLDc N-terminal domain-containing protein [Actinomycetota bacterium]|nr:PLDc N-terminal domain-containing protein [Actinomycetota bacterium]